MRKLVTLLLTGAFLLPACSAAAQRGNLEPEQFLKSFIRAFDDLDWNAFRHSFSEDATVFYPRGKAERAAGRAEFEEKFKVVFEQIRAGRTSPPYMDIQPRGLKIQRFGDIAIVTFHLDDRAGFVNRRTLVLRRSAGEWKIIHLHASEVAVTH